MSAGSISFLKLVASIQWCWFVILLLKAIYVCFVQQNANDM